MDMIERHNERGIDMTRSIVTKVRAMGSKEPRWAKITKVIVGTLSVLSLYLWMAVIRQLLGI